MPLAQLKEPWPLMELVPLDPENGQTSGEEAGLQLSKYVTASGPRWRETSWLM
ncbi:RPS6KA1 isoform 15 [Pongo abelii]|uniref:RPS6KA1 isoform 15 n=1 Tax=Pongo abelii TaxID=9601 RepID=A0A2J8SIG1_PONAB|nr:RPS6KA1 isoform 15 [Pongo abelii]